MPQVLKAIRQERAAHARDLSHQIYQKGLDKMVGKQVSVLVEQTGLGYTENYFPVQTKRPDLAGQILTAVIQGKEKDELVF